MKLVFTKSYVFIIPFVLGNDRISHLLTCKTSLNFIIIVEGLNVVSTGTSFLFCNLFSVALKLSDWLFVTPVKEEYTSSSSKIHRPSELITYMKYKY